MRGLASTLEACLGPTTHRPRAHGAVRVSGHRQTAGCADQIHSEIRSSFAPRKRMRSTLARHFPSYSLRWAVALILIALSWLAPRKALAQRVAGLTIRWEAPARCPQQRDVSEGVRKLSGSPTSVQGELQADGTITQADDGRFHLRLLLRSGGLVGERNIDSRSCADLSRAAAVAIALLLHSDEPLSQEVLGGEHSADGAHEGAERVSGPAVPADDRPQPENKPTASEPPKQTQELDAASEHGDATTQPSNHREHVRLRAPIAALSVGPLPRPDWGLSFAVGASYVNWRFWLEGTDWLQQTVPSKDFPGYSANVKRRTASLKACRASRFSVFEVAPCLVVSLEHVSAAGAGPNVAPQSQQVNWIGAGVGVQGRVYLASWLSLALSFDGTIEASRARLSIGGVGLVDQVAPAAFTTMVGPEWIL
jgi:hypothetical protein